MTGDWISVCAECFQAVMVEHHPERRLTIVRDAFLDERRALVESLRANGLGRFEIATGDPGRPHVCPREIGKPRILMALHRRTVTSLDWVVCSHCRHSAVEWPDLPMLIDPGFAQRVWLSKILDPGKLAAHPFALGELDGTCRAHQCVGVIRQVDGAKLLCRSIRDVGECGEGEGRVGA